MVPRRGGAQRLLSQAGGSTGLLMDLAANEKAVHADFFNGKDRRAPGVCSTNLAWLLSRGSGAWWSLNLSLTPSLGSSAGALQCRVVQVGAIKWGISLSWEF